MDDANIIQSRVQRLLRECIRPAIYAPGVPLTVTAHTLAGEPVPRDALPPLDSFAPFTVGGKWAPAWGTTWFRFRGTVPVEWRGERVEAVIDLGFGGDSVGFQAEGLVWGPEGPRHGLHPCRRWSLVSDRAAGGETVDLLVEAAANPWIFTRTPMHDVATAPRDPLYQLRQAELAVLRPEVWHLELELDFLARLARQQPADGPRRWKLLAAISDACDAIDHHDVPSCAAAARATLAPVLAAPAHASAHRLSAIGHAHMDTAWLWPLRETVRKCTRTFASAIELMDVYPEYRFGCSQAAQYEWIEQRQPELFAAMTKRAETGQWVPLGGMWVEADCNLAGGEALVRQFVHGQRYFRERFGVTCREVWIPDVFGYPASLPQIFVLAGADAFLTQKMSWNRTNVFPHHTFAWEGIDGTQIFTHFPPVETYSVDFDPGELAKANKVFKDHARASMSLAPFGYGDGGGGPTREMLERARLAHDLEGAPRVVIESPQEFFAAARAEYADPPVWRGELYLEMHRGTYTSQARTKALNRACELALRGAEWWSVAAFGGVRSSGYPLDAFDRAWKDLLILQFHDILPGSSIGWVYRDAEQQLESVLARADAARDIALRALVEPGDALVLANPAPHDRSEIVLVWLPPGAAAPVGSQGLADGRVAVWCEVNAGEISEVVQAAPMQPVVVGDRWADNGLVRIEWDGHGLLTSIRDVEHDREVLRAGARGNVLELSPDLPLEFDAWDIERYYRGQTRALTEVDEIEVLDAGPLCARIRFTRSFAGSTFAQTLVVRAASRRIDFECEVDWQADEALLKVAFPVDVHADRAACEIQFGHVFRPTHSNTSWDEARFEICAHRFVDLSESGYGVALLNDSKYGYDVLDGSLRLTLLKAANYPAIGADRGTHRFTYALLPHAGDLRTGEVVQEGYRLNCAVVPLAAAPGTWVRPPVRSDHPGVVVEAVKAAEDGSGDVVVRVYEAWGGRADATLTFDRDITGFTVCDVLEDPLDAASDAARAVTAERLDSRRIAVSLRPFRILTLRITPA
jgi:alpha-mannosidase